MKYIKYLAFLCAVLLFSLFANSVAFAFFNDVSSSHSSYDAIEYVQSEGIVVGYDDGTYKPDQPINRAEFIKIIMESITDDISGSDCFPDVTDQWFAGYVCTAEVMGIISGYPDGEFKPADNINFAEAAKILATAWEDVGGPAEVWYESFVNFLAEAGAIPVSIYDFGKNITRAEMAEMIYRLKAQVYYKPSQTYDTLVEGWTEKEWDDYIRSVSDALLRLYIIDDAGDSIPGCTIQITDDATSNRSGTIYTDIFGKVSMYLPAGDYVVDAVCAGYEPFSGVTSIEEQEYYDEFIVMEPQEDAAVLVGLDGFGSGTVTSIPLGIKCPGNCSEIYQYEEGIILTAEADPGSYFYGWEGDCIEIGFYKCEIEYLYIDTAIVAIFELEEEIAPDPDPVADPDPIADPDPVTDPGPVTNPLLTIDSSSCELAYEDIYSKQIRIVANGTASGPVGTELYIQGYVDGEDQPTCGSWTFTGSSWYPQCTRMSGEPETTNWSYISGDTYIIIDTMDFYASASYQGVSDNESQVLACP